MIYRTPPDLRLWDTWMLKEGSEYHLFTLTQPYELSYWDRVCHAVSSDLINWENSEDILLEEKENKEAWDAGVILTGSAFKYGQSYAMTYGAIKHGERVQKIGLIFSKDLHRWKKYSGNPVLVPTGPFYEDNPDATTEDSIAWRDAYVVPVENGYEAFIAANDARMTKTVNGCVARVFSKDLIHWEYFPPIVSPERYVDMEVPQYFEFNGYHYFLFSTGTGVDTPSRFASRGTYYVVAKTKYGEYKIPEDNLLIGSGELRLDCYVGKIIFADDGPLLYHHITGKRTSFAAPKVLCQGDDGKLWLERWKGINTLLGDQVLTLSSPGAVIKAYNQIPIGRWEKKDNKLIGDAGPAISGWLFEKPLQDCALQAVFNIKGVSQMGVLFRLAARPDSSQVVKGLALSLNKTRGVIHLCEAQIESRRAVELKILDNVYGRLDEYSELEIFLRAEYAEIYYNKRPLFVFNIANYPLEGKVGFFVKEGKVVLDNFQAREIPVKLR